MKIKEVGWLGEKTVALTFLGTIYHNKNQRKLEDKDINHEAIHWKQQKETFIIIFLLVYFTEYLLKSIWYFNFFKGNINISFERECYINENNLDYLKTRKSYSWINYIFKK